MTSIAALLFWILALQNPAPAPSQARVGTGAVSGITVSARKEDSEPLSNVRITLRAITVAQTSNQAPPPAPIELQASSDRDGNFLFPAVPAGRYTITSERVDYFRKDGYFSQIDRVDSSIVTVEAERKLEGIVVRLTVLPAITGVVYSPNGTRLPGATVRAYRIQFTPYGRQIRIASSALSNERGEYRLFHLTPGSYLVSASYGDWSLRPWKSVLKLPPNLPPQDEGYSTIYFPNEPSTADAKPVALFDQNDVEHFDIRFRESRHFSLSIRLLLPHSLPEGCPGSLLNPRVAVLPFGADLGSINDYQIEGIGTDFSVQHLAEGDYVLVAFANVVEDNGKAVPKIVSDPQQIRLSENTKTIITAMDVVTIAGKVSSDSIIAGRSANPLPNGMEIKLARADNLVDQTFTASIGLDGTFDMLYVSPGTYDVFLEGLPLSAFLQEAGFSTSDRRTMRVTIDERQPLREWRPPMATCPKLTSLDPFTATFGLSNGNVSGIVNNDEGKRSPNTLVVLVPTNPLYRSRKDRYFTTASDANGSFRFQNIPRGNYLAFALESGESGIYYDPTFNSRVGPKTVPVNIIPVANINLRTITLLEMKNIMQ